MILFLSQCLHILHVWYKQFFFFCFLPEILQKDSQVCASPEPRFGRTSGRFALKGWVMLHVTEKNGYTLTVFGQLSWILYMCV